MYYKRDIYFVNFHKNVGSQRFLGKDRYFVKIPKEDRYFGNKPLVAYFQPKIVKPLLDKGFKLNIFEDINLSSGHLIWQSTDVLDISENECRVPPLIHSKKIVGWVEALRNPTS